MSPGIGDAVAFALGNTAGPEDPLLADIAKRHRGQIKADLVAQFLPQIVGKTSAAVAAAADRRARAAAHRMERLVDRNDDVGDPRLVAVVREEIAAAWPAHAADQPAATQFGEQLFEVGQRDLLPGGD